MSAADHVNDGSGRVIVDLLGRYERRASFLEEIGERMGVLHLGRLWLLRANDGGSVTQSEYVHACTSDTRDLVAKLYVRDVELFGYEF